MKPLFPDLNLLTEVFKKRRDIQAVYLFGSVAAGKANARSDIDLGVVPRDPSAREKKLDLLAEITALGFNRIDLVFLDACDIVSRFEAVRQNKLLYCAEDFDAASYFSLTLRQYFDFLPYLNAQREAYKRRILQNGDKA